MGTHKYDGALHDFANCDECKRPVITHAQYSKNMYAVSCRSDGTGFKTKMQAIAGDCTTRYSNREQSYIMSKAQVRRFIKLIAPILPLYYDYRYSSQESNELSKEIGI